MKFLKTTGPYMSKIQLMLGSIDHEARIAINLTGEFHAVRTSV